MNKITKYIDALPLSDAEKSALPDTSLQAVHQALDDDHQTFAREDDSPLGSVKARLAHSWPDSLSGDQLVKDDEGRTQLHAMPKAKRSSMIPDPWRTNPVGRFWDRLRGRDVTPRYLSRLTQEERESEQKWRTVGTIRRYILLLLTLSQTVVATWYMKTILPYQGWALINQELEEGLISVAAPLLNAQGQVVAAINVSGQANRTNAQEMQARIVPPLLRTAQ